MVPNEYLRNSMNIRNQNVNLAKIELHSSTRKDVLIYSYNGGLRRRNAAN